MVIRKEIKAEEFKKNKWLNCPAVSKLSVFSLNPPYRVEILLFYAGILMITFYPTFIPPLIRKQTGTLVISLLKRN